VENVNKPDATGSNNDAEKIKKHLATVAVWRVSHNAAFLGVSPLFYRRHIMSLENHPGPLDAQAPRLQYWGAEMREYLSDFGNLKKPSR
jgi:hypothetical protein